MIATAIDEALAQDLLDHEEEAEVQHLGKLYNGLYIQMEACCTNFKLFFYSFGRLLSNEHRFYPIRIKLPLLFPTVIDESLAQDLLDDEEVQE